jgi:uracil-DNA glycosylase
MPSEQQLGKGWYEALKPVFTEPWWHELHRKVMERARYGIQPQPRDIFRAFRESPLEETKVVIFAQDPYPTDYADGLAFSSGNGKLPKSLEYIYRQVEFEYGKRPESYSLEGWARQGVLLINTSLTVDNGRPMSHSEFGWDKFVKAVFHILDERGAIFVAWGSPARKLLANAGVENSSILVGPHPIAESYSNGRIKFVGGNYFKRINELLVQQGKELIKWV